MQFKYSWYNAYVAQLVEHSLRKGEVVGSTPTVGSTAGVLHTPERSSENNSSSAWSTPIPGSY